MRTLLIILILKLAIFQVEQSHTIVCLIGLETTLEERVNQLEKDWNIFRKSYELSEQEKLEKAKKEKIYCYIFMILSIMGYIMLAIYLIRKLKKYKIELKQNKRGI